MSIEEKFTPGPWYIRPRTPEKTILGTTTYTRTTILDDANGEYSPKHVIAQIARGNGREEANAALIAEAPEMYSELNDCAGALTEILASIVEGRDVPDTLIAMAQDEVDNAAATLKKARGEA